MEARRRHQQQRLQELYAHRARAVAAYERAIVTTEQALARIELAIRRVDAAIAEELVRRALDEPPEG